MIDRYGIGAIDLQNPVNRHHPINNGLVAWYLPLPGLDGGTTLYDIMGLYHGPLTNVTNSSYGWKPDTRVGSPGACLVFGSGTTDHVEIGAPSGLEIYTGSFSVSAWVKTTSVSTSFVVSKDFSTGSRGFGLGTNSTAYYLEWGGAIAVSTSAGVNDGFWHQIGFDYDGTNISWFVDGVVQGTVAKSPLAANTSAKWYISGRHYTGFFQGFDGRINDVQIRVGARSAGQIRAAYDEAKMGYRGTLNRVLIPMGQAPVVVAGNTRFGDFLMVF